VVFLKLKVYEADLTSLNVIIKDSIIAKYRLGGFARVLLLRIATSVFVVAGAHLNERISNLFIKFAKDIPILSREAV
jgi:hypothetical protein